MLMAQGADISLQQKTRPLGLSISNTSVSASGFSKLITTPIADLLLFRTIRQKIRLLPHFPSRDPRTRAALLEAYKVFMRPRRVNWRRAARYQRESSVNADSESERGRPGGDVGHIPFVASVGSRIIGMYTLGANYP